MWDTTFIYTSSFNYIIMFYSMKQISTIKFSTDLNLLICPIVQSTQLEDLNFRHWCHTQAMQGNGHPQLSDDAVKRLVATLRWEKREQPWDHGLKEPSNRWNRLRTVNENRENQSTSRSKFKNGMVWIFDQANRFYR